MNAKRRSLCIVLGVAAASVLVFWRLSQPILDPRIVGGWTLAEPPLGQPLQTFTFGNDGIAVVETEGVKQPMTMSWSRESELLVLVSGVRTSLVPQFAQRVYESMTGRLVASRSEIRLKILSIDQNQMKLLDLGPNGVELDFRRVLQ